MRNVLAYELSAVPQSMLHDDGTLRKTKKADMAKKLEEQCDDCLSYRKLVWCSPNLQRTWSMNGNDPVPKRQPRQNIQWSREGGMKATFADHE